MKYHELLELYKKKALNEEQMKKVEQDIERQEAIGEYLFDREEKMEFGFLDEDNETVETDYKDNGENLWNSRKADEMSKDNSLKKSARESEKADQFAREINRSIRRAFIKMGTIVGTVVLVILLLIVFVVPKVVDEFYYDPGKIVAKSKDGGETNQMSLDLAVYTELTLPGRFRDHVEAEEKGYGKYNIDIYQTMTRTNRFNNVSGELVRDKLRIYDLNAVYSITSGNVFGWGQMNPDLGKSLTELSEEEQKKDESCFIWQGADKESATKALKQLDENQLYQSYVTLDRPMDYDTFVKYLNKYKDKIDDVWCLVRTDEVPGFYQMSGGPGLLGFYVTLGQSSSVAWDTDQYPNLVVWNYELADTGEEKKTEKTAETTEAESVENATETFDGWDRVREKMKETDFAKNRFVTMLKYMSNQDKFLGAICQQSGERYKDAADYVEQNGLEIYGFACVGYKADLLKINQTEEVFGIYTEELQ